MKGRAAESGYAFRMKRATAAIGALGRGAPYGQVRPLVSSSVLSLERPLCN